MPIDLTIYPKNWIAFSKWVRFTRAWFQCECTGECGQHHSHRCEEIHRQEAKHHRGKVILTTAHLCRCRPICANPAHVKAMCQACHLRFDRYLRWAHRTSIVERLTKLDDPNRPHP